MDLGATICSKNQPKCEQCPINRTCLARAKDVIAQYPEKKSKVKQTEVDLFVLLSVDQQQIALSQRNDQSIWPKLWFLPLFDTETELLNAYNEAQAHFSLTHKLTHRILQIHVYLLKQAINSTTVKMIDRQDLRNQPHPKALIHILNQHDNH
jgi:A/G-specific adenine glycosylase